jgi:hypothetical protein
VSPPAIAPSPSGYIYPVVDAPADETKFWCLTANPSCGRDPWWVEWNELQRDSPVQYSFLAPGLATEYRFVEAIWMIWQWPDGKFLLREAAAHGVRIVSAPFPVAALASYRTIDRVVRVNEKFDETSTWMLADIMAHELKHAADDRAGVRSGPTYADCIAREQAAYQVEAKYLQWVSARFGGLPGPSMVQSRLSPEDYLLYLNLYHIATSRNVDATALDDYRKACAA